MKTKCTCGCNEDVTRKTNLRHLAGSGTKAALVQQQHTLLRKHIFHTWKARHHHTPTPRKKPPNGSDLAVRSESLPSPVPSNLYNVIAEPHEDEVGEIGMYSEPTNETSNQLFDVDMDIDDKDAENRGVQPNSECDATNLARAAHVWNSNRELHGNESDSDLEASESDKDKDSDFSSSYLVSGLESSDEDDDWGAQTPGRDNDELPAWQMGLTAADILEEDFEGEAICRGNAQS